MIRIQLHNTEVESLEHLFRAKGIRVRKSAMQAFCRRHELRLYRPTYRFLRGAPEKQAVARQELADLKNGAVAGELVLLSQEEARFPMVPTLCRTLGVMGHRPVVGTRDCKHLVDVFAVVNGAPSPRPQSHVRQAVGTGYVMVGGTTDGETIVLRLNS